MNTIKRTAAGIMALAVVISLASCSKNGETKTREPQTADKVLNKAFSAVDISGSFPSGLKNIEAFAALGDSGEYLVTGYGDEYREMEMYITDENFSDFRKIAFEAENTDYVQSYYTAMPMSDGTILVYISKTDFGDKKIPDWNDPDFDSENFDYEDFYAGAEYSYSLCNLDREGNILSESEIKGLDKFKGDDDDGDFYIGQILPLGDGCIIEIGDRNEEGFYSMSLDGELGKKIDLGERTYISSPSLDSDGNVVFTSWGDSGENLMTIEADTMTLSKDVLKYKDLGIENNVQSISKGRGDYRVFICGITSLYGITSDNKAVEVVNWTASDINGQYVQSVVALENNEFIVLERNWNNGGRSTVYRMSERDISELANTKIINLVSDYPSSDILDMVKKFNQEHTDYRINFEDYEKYYEWDEKTEKTVNTPSDQLKMDIAAGKAIDILILSDSTSLFPNLANKGMFTDLYQLIEKDDSLKKEDFAQNVLKACENNGKLVKIAPEFNVSTFAAKKKFIDKDSWTFDEFVETYNKYSDKMSLFAYFDNKKNLLDLLMRCYNNGFIDFKNGTCSFDSPEFIKMLEFVNGMDLSVDSERIWETMTEEEEQKYYEDRQTACRNDKALLADAYFYDARRYIEVKYGEFGEDITLVGYPTESGSGAKLNVGRGISITEKCACKDACWEFIKLFLSDDYYSSNNRNSFPSVIKYLDEQLDEAMEDPYWIDQDGKKMSYKYSVWTGKESIDAPNLTKAERDMVKDYILSADSLDYYYDQKIYDIVHEEVDAYFNGEKSAKDAAQILQNRISILVSEQS